MHSSLFFKLFPPPKFLLMPHVGIDVSDDAISFIQYSRPVGNRAIIKFGRIPLEQGIVDGGDIKDEQKLITALADFARTHALVYAKISIPEEKAYLFETEIPNDEMKVISQNIEFKLEENIPLAAPDAVFTFDLLPGGQGRPWRASVSAVPKSYIEHMMDMFRKAGINPVAFETTPKAIARVVSYEEEGGIIVIHAMSRKTGVYIISQHAVGFTSTISAGVTESVMSSYTDVLAEEIRRVHTYWSGKNGGEESVIKHVIVVGQDAEAVSSALRGKVSDLLPVYAVDVWRSVLDTSHYVPPILKEDSFEYVTSAGLAL